MAGSFFSERAFSSGYAVIVTVSATRLPAKSCRSTCLSRVGIKRPSLCLYTCSIYVQGAFTPIWGLGE